MSHNKTLVDLGMVCIFSVIVISQKSLLFKFQNFLGAFEVKITATATTLYK